MGKKQRDLITAVGLLLEAASYLQRAIWADVERQAGLPGTWFETLVRLQRSDSAGVRMNQMAAQVSFPQQLQPARRPYGNRRPGRAIPRPRQQKGDPATADSSRRGADRRGHRRSRTQRPGTIRQRTIRAGARRSRVDHPQASRRQPGEPDCVTSSERTPLAIRAVRARRRGIDLMSSVTTGAALMPPRRSAPASPRCIKPCRPLIARACRTPCT